MIPKTIHQIYLQGGDLPSRLQRNVDLLKSLNPDWEHRIWDASAAEAELRGAIQDAYQRIDPRYAAARADLLRHFIIHRYGGVYFDIKSGSSKPLDTILRSDDSYVLSQWKNGWERLHRELDHIPGGEYVTHFLAACPAHQFSRAALEAIVNGVKVYRPWNAVGRNGVVRTTGPVAYTLAVHPIIERYPHRFATLENLGVYVSLDGYVFPNHYSLLRVPVVNQGPLGGLVSRSVNLLRELKSSKLVRLGRRPTSAIVRS